MANDQWHSTLRNAKLAALDTPGVQKACAYVKAGTKHVTLLGSLNGIIRLPTLSLPTYDLPVLWSRTIMFTAALLFSFAKGASLHQSTHSRHMHWASVIQLGVRCRAQPAGRSVRAAAARALGTAIRRLHAVHGAHGPARGHAVPGMHSRVELD